MSAHRRPGQGHTERTLRANDGQPDGLGRFSLAKVIGDEFVGCNPHGDRNVQRVEAPKRRTGQNQAGFAEGSTLDVDESETFEHIGDGEL